jgi:hypothetical protein
MSDEIVITDKDDNGMKKMYYRCFICPNCKGEQISRHFMYCQDCGSRLTFDESAKALEGDYQP